VELSNHRDAPNCAERVCCDTRSSSTNSGKVEEEGQNPIESPSELVQAHIPEVQLCEMRV